MKADGTIDKYKARLVVKGFRQREGLDFFDTYLPVTRITSIRMPAYIGVANGMGLIKASVDDLRYGRVEEGSGIAGRILYGMGWELGGCRM
ncbi:GATA transcription factor 9-like protein [Tanacetum coccineum]